MFENSVKKFLLGIVFIALSISWGLNIYFLCGKGIFIDRSITNHQEQFQQQWQGQLLINQWAAQGDVIEWKVIELRGDDWSLVQKELGKLHPISSMYAKIIYEHTRVSGVYVKILYPDIFIKIKEKEIIK